MTTRPRADEARTVAIAGANGMVGHHLVEALQASGERTSINENIARSQVELPQQVNNVA